MNQGRWDRGIHKHRDTRNALVMDLYQFTVGRSITRPGVQAPPFTLLIAVDDATGTVGRGPFLREGGDHICFLLTQGLAQSVALPWPSALTGTGSSGARRGPPSPEWRPSSARPSPKSAPAFEHTSVGWSRNRPTWTAACEGLPGKVRYGEPMTNCCAAFPE